MFLNKNNEVIWNLREDKFQDRIKNLSTKRKIRITQKYIRHVLFTKSFKANFLEQKFIILYITLFQIHMGLKERYVKFLKCINIFKWCIKRKYSSECENNVDEVFWKSRKENNASENKPGDHEKKNFWQAWILDVSIFPKDNK